LVSLKLNNGIRMSQNNKDRKFPSALVISLSLVVAWLLYSGKTIGRGGGASRIDDPYMYWGIVAFFVGVILYKIVEYFDL
jgi:predicted membrane channel-forming protein YqfA (hemolysin III family)